MRAQPRMRHLQRARYSAPCAVLPAPVLVRLRYDEEGSRGRGGRRGGSAGGCSAGGRATAAASAS
jgi:hypothetical protein